MVLFYVLQFRTEREFQEFISAILSPSIIITALILGFLIWKYSTEKEEIKKGIHSNDSKFDTENILKAYISLSAFMLKGDLSDNSTKIAYMNNYFKKEFNENYVSFNGDIHSYFKHEIKLDSVCEWLIQHIEIDRCRFKIVSFLTGMSLTNGTIKPNDYQFLKELVNLLKLDQQEFESMINLRIRNNNREEESTKKRTRVRSNFSKSKSILCYQILNISSTSSIEDIKKAYRKLVMKHHPDKFDSLGHSQLRLAQEKFLKIQGAYEYVMKIKRETRV